MNYHSARKKVKSLLIYISILLFGLGLIIYSKETSKAATEALKICANVLIPSLFPFFVVSSIAVSTGFAHTVGRAFKRPMEVLFNLPGACAPAFILGLVGGYPVGAQTAISLYKQNLCTKNQAERLLSFCNNSGPAFILGAVGAMVFGATSAGILLYMSHVLASVAVGIIFRRYKVGPLEGKNERKTSSFSPMPLAKAFTSGVSSSMMSVLNICAFVVFFSVAVRILTVSGILSGISATLARLMSPLGLNADFAESLLSGLLEVTGGVYGLKGTAPSMGAKLSAAAFMLGWAGLSVHSQVLSFIGDSGLSAFPYIVGKVLHGAISAVFAFFGTWILPYDLEVSKTYSGQIIAIYSLSPVKSFAFTFLIVIGIWALFSVVNLLAKKKKSNKKIAS